MNVRLLVCDRNEDNKLRLEQALTAISQALKQKQGELAAWVKGSGVTLKEQLESGQKQLEQRLVKLQEVRAYC